MKTMSIPYNLYTIIDGMKIYKRLLEDKYIIEFSEDGKTTTLHFYFDPNDNLIINNIYKNMRNYKTYRHIKKYAENKTLINAIMQLKGE